MEFLSIEKPLIVQIQVIEAIGILMRIPFREGKSRYKAPSPSNYDATVDLLANDFANVVNTLMAYSTKDIPNDVAKQFYAKTLEPGFDYEAAVLFSSKFGCSLLLRDLFNSLVLILQTIREQDPYRIPVVEQNVFVVMDGARYSYAALDIGVHVFGHGVCNVGVIKINDRITSREEEVLLDHIPEDVMRRLVQQYHMADHCFNVNQLVAPSSVETVDVLRDALNASRSTVLVVGVDVNKSTGSDNLAEILQWAAYEQSHIADLKLIIAKSCSSVRPFTALGMPRTFMVCCTGKDDLPSLFKQCVSLMNHDDFVIMHAILDDSQPEGVHSKFSRFGGGYKEACWTLPESTIHEDAKLLEEKKAANRPLFPEWNTTYKNELQTLMGEIISQAQVNGRVCIEYSLESTAGDRKSKAQQIMDRVFLEKVDLVVVGNREKQNNELCKELIDECQCAVVLC